MPKTYFNYKSLDDLRRDAAQLGVELPLVADPEEVKSLLARPVDIGGESGKRRTIGNSLAIHPMEGCDGNADGTPSAFTFRRYRRFGAGGAKLIWFEACAVLPEGRANPRQLWIHHGSQAELRRLLDECRQEHRKAFGTTQDLVCVLQLTHSGRYSYRDHRVAYHHPILDGYPYVAPLAAPPRPAPFEVASDEYLAQLEDCFVEGATLAREIGFDGIDLKMTHGYLLSEILSARTRPGIYGGPLENRARLGLNILRKIRAALGDDFLLAARLGVFDGVPYAVAGTDVHGEPRPFERPYVYGFGVDPNDPEQMDLSEPACLVGWMRGAGLRLLNVSLGNPYTNPHLGRPYEKPNEGCYFTPEHPLLGVARHFQATATLKRAVPSLPMVGTGYSWLQHFMFNAGAANLKLGRVDLVGVGRGALAYPEFARDVLQTGAIDPLRTCKTLSFCTYLMRQKNHPMGQFPTGCPPYDKEGYGAVMKEARHAARQKAQ